MTEIINQFHLLRPWWLLAALPALLLAVLLWRGMSTANQWQQLIAPQLLPYLLDRGQIQQKRWPLLGILALWILASIALAGPAWKKVPQPVEQRTGALVICWDLSPSMLAQDISPSRLVRSRLKIIDLVKSRKEGQTALVAYSAEAYTVTPLTDDTRTIVNLLPALSPTTLPSVGSNPEMALEQALQLLKDAGASSGDVLFVTDKIDPDAFDYMGNLLKGSPHKLSVWGIGSEEGAPIPLPQGGFAKDNSGDIVVAKLNEEELQEFTTRIAAYYVPMVPSENDVQTLLRLFEDRTATTAQSERVFDQWFEHGQYLVWLLLPGLLLLFRRGWVFSLILCIPFGLPDKAHALEWDSLWLNQNQRAKQKLEQGQGEAADQFKEPLRRGNAWFEQGSIEQAAEAYAAGEGPKNAYNRGTALTLGGRYEEAIDAFEQALALQPDWPAAKENLAIAEALLEHQQQQEQQQNSDDQQSSSSQDQSGDQQQNGDSQNQDASGANGEQDSSSQSQQAQSDDAEQSGQAGDQAQANQGDQGQQDESEETGNPYSDAFDQQEKEQQGQQTQAQQAQPEQAGDPDEQGEPSASMAVTESGGQTEEEQMLEQMLRKVPDDPSGLLRNKFRYQYLERKQSLRQQNPFSEEEAENRW